MALKHLLNFEYEENEHLDHRPFDWIETNESVETTPILQNTSWNSYAAQLLGSESDQNAESHSFILAQEQIEQWAYDNVSSFTARSTATPSTYDEQICYGMIYRSSIRLLGNMLAIDAKLGADHNSPVPGHYQMTICKSEELFDVSFGDGTPFGRVESQLERALESMREQQYQLDFDVYAPIRPIRDTISRATKVKEAVVRVNIVVYGPQSIASGVGQELSRHKIYLQSPDHVRTGLLYKNPHILILPVENFQYPSSQQKIETREARNVRNGIQEAEAFKKTISTIYLSLTRGQSLVALEGDERLKTKLLTHQKEALNFMAQRESGPIPEKFRLWVPIEIEGVPCFRHVITAQIEFTETGGGILADEMGMGKTLSILALILRTIAEARDWVLEGEDTVIEAQESRRSQRRSKATLVVASSDLMINEWFQEIERHFQEDVRDVISTIKYHGSNRKANVENLYDADIIITTYRTLYSDFSKDKSPLNNTEWYRLVLDEAHIIRRQSSVFNRAVSELKARSRWCLTGTPIQNRLEDIGSLFVFLKIVPFDTLSIFRRDITIPFDEGGERRKLAIIRFTRLLDSLCLRRSKELLHLPSSQNHLHMIDFSNEERIQYEHTKNMMLRAMKNQVGGLGLFQAHLQLRILCNHGTYQQLFNWNRRKIELIDEREDMAASLGQEGEGTCSACTQPMSLLNISTLFRRDTENCRHVLCVECMEDSVPGAGKDKLANCPLCPVSSKQPSAQQQSHNASSEEDLYFRPQGTSSKMEALMRDIQVNLHTTKSIIFSCWTHTLDLISFHLNRANIMHHRIDGECPTSKREAILREFAHKPHLRVLIMTTGTGAVGLNLATANKVFIIEPQWNPSVENQAIARALRLGQQHEVEVHRYVVNGTVEQDMRSLQDKKLKIAGMAWE